MTTNYLVSKQIASDGLINTNVFTKKAAVLAWTICGLGALYYFYEYFLRVSLSVMTAELMRDYHLTGAQIGNLSAFYYWAYVIMQIIVGLLMDRYGPRRLLTVACLLCVAGTYLFAASYNVEMAAIGRFLVGLGSAFAFVGAAKLATVWLPPNRFALVSGIILCLGMIGAMVGDILLRALIDAIGWRTALFGSAGAGIVLSFFIWLVVRDSNPAHANHYAHQPIDLPGVLAGLLRAIKNPQIWLTGLVGFLLFLSLSAFAELWGVPYLEQGRGLSKVAAAHANSIVFLGWAVGGPLWGWLSDYIRLRRMPILAGSIGALVSVCILLYFPNLSLSFIYATLFIFGLLSSAQILVFALAREAMPIKMAGTTIGLLNMIVMIGGVIFQPLIGKILDLNWTGTMMEGARVYSPSAYAVALSLLPIGVLVAIILLFFIQETHCRIDVDEFQH